MDQETLLKFGNELEMKGVCYGNAKESILLMFPEYTEDTHIYLDDVVNLDVKGWEDVIQQTDVLNVQGLNKVILRKSQRQIEQNVSWNVYRRDNYTCQYCGKNDVPLTVDHIVLWEKNGASHEDNLISACRKCNKTRGNMEFEEWLNSDYLIYAVKAWKDYKWGEHISHLRDLGIKALKVPLRNTPRNR